MRGQTHKPATTADTVQPPPVRWYSLTAEEAARQQRVDPASGLDDPDVRARTARYGPNRLTENESRSLPAMLLDQLRDVMILILLAAALVSGLIGELIDTLAICCALASLVFVAVEIEKLLVRRWWLYQTKPSV